MKSDLTPLFPLMVEPRAARSTLRFVDKYCEHFTPLFPEVRSFEAFKYLHVGMISELKRKTLPAIARAVGLDNEQGLHHLLTKSPWSVMRTPLAELYASNSTQADFAISQRTIDETANR
jgi:SRSO17 transposase